MAFIFVGLFLIKSHRKLVGAKDFTDFKAYVEAIIRRSKGLEIETSPDEFRKKMMAAYDECLPLFKHVR